MNMENETTVVNQPTETKVEPKAEKKDEKSATPTVEELLTQLAQEKATSAKYKNSIDKLTKSNGDLTKQLREHLTAEEQLQQAQAEADEQHNAYVKELEDFKRTAEAKDRYMSIQGMDSETASKAALAEVTGDYNALSTIQSQFNELKIKNAQAEWLKSRPQLNAGVGDEETSVTKEQFANMGYKELVEFKTKFPNTYKAYTTK